MTAKAFCFKLVPTCTFQRPPKSLVGFATNAPSTPGSFAPLTRLGHDLKMRDHIHFYIKLKHMAGTSES